VIFRFTLEVIVAFEKFIPPRKKKAPKVSVKRTGSIAFDPAAVEAFGLAKVSAVTLHFDPARKLLGVQVAETKEEGAHRLTHRQRVSSVRAKAFFDAYGIPLDQTRQLALSKEREAGMTIFDLSDVKRRPGRRKKVG
jgi:hypothetical protein